MILPSSVPTMKIVFKFLLKSQHVPANNISSWVSKKATLAGPPLTGDKERGGTTAIVCAIVGFKRDPTVSAGVTNAGVSMRKLIMSYHFSPQINKIK